MTTEVAVVSWSVPAPRASTGSLHARPGRGLELHWARCRPHRSGDPYDGPRDSVFTVPGLLPVYFYIAERDVVFCLKSFTMHVLIISGRRTRGQSLQKALPFPRVPLYAASLL